MNKHINQVLIVIKSLLQDRGMFSIYFIMALIAVVNVLYIIITLRPSDLQLVSHYTAFGPTHLYRANWLDQSKTIFISLSILIFHILISQTVLIKISRPLAKFIAWSGVFILIFVLINSSLIINVWSPK